MTHQGSLWPPDPPVETFAARLEQHGDAIAIVTPDGLQLSYSELAARADAFAATLGGARRLVMIEAVNEVEPLAAYLGALRHGHPVLMTGGGSPHERLVDIYRPDAIFSKQDGRWATSHRDAGGHVLHPDLALLLPTSGSTGAAKLVRLSHDAIEANTQSIAEYLTIGAGDCAITTLPIYYGYGLSVVASHLARGARIALTGASVIEPDFWRFFEQAGATFVAGVPYTYELLERIKFRAMAVPTLRTMTQSGGAMPTETLQHYAAWSRRRGIDLFTMYGQTESTARMSYLPPSMLPDHLGAIGIAIPGGSFRLADAAGASVTQPDVEGELVYTGRNVMMGYALTAGDFAKGREIEALFTGDLARRGADGIYWMAGRKSRFSKLFGLRISLDEVEAILARHGLRGVVAGDDSMLAVALIGTATELDDVRGMLSAATGLPPAVLDVTCLGQRPRLGNGKTDYQTILTSARKRAERAGSAADTAIRTAFRQAFPRVAIRDDDTFISLAGDSLNYVSLSVALEQQIGYLPERWEERPIAALERLAAAAGSVAQPLPHRRPARVAIETEVVIRAVAILTVVLNHAGGGIPVSGGAYVLMMLAGYNLARYQRARLVRGGGWSILGAFLRRFMLPYYLILVAYLLWAGELRLPTLLLVDNFTPRKGFLQPYWFMDSLLQCLIAITLLFALPMIRRSAERTPWRFGVALLSATVALRIAAFALVPHDAVANRTPDAVFFLLALGWCLRFADSAARKYGLSAVAALLAIADVTGIPGLWYRYPVPNNISHGLWLFAAAALVLWVPRTALPRPVHRAVSIVAAASFYIYLSHEVVLRVLGYHHLLLTKVVPYAGTIDRAIGLAACIPVGLALWLCVRKMGSFEGLVRSAWDRLVRRPTAAIRLEPRAAKVETPRIAADAWLFEAGTSSRGERR